MDRAGHGRDRGLGRSQPFRRRRGARSHAARSPGTERSHGARVNSAPSAPLRRLGDAELGHARRSDASDESEDGAARLRARVSHASRDGWGLGVRPLALSAALLVAFLLAGGPALAAPSAALPGAVTSRVHATTSRTGSIRFGRAIVGLYAFPGTSLSIPLSRTCKPPRRDA